LTVAKNAFVDCALNLSVRMLLKAAVTINYEVTIEVTKH